MEGTSGAADRVPFREGAREAALCGELAKAGLPGGPWGVLLIGDLRGAGFSIPAPERIRDSRCPSRSGWGKALDASDRVREEQGLDWNPTLAPGPWNLGWPSFERSVGHPSGRLFEAAKAVVISRPGAALGGDPGRGERGSIDQAVVLNDRFDCRSRHAARGPRDPGQICPRNRGGSSPFVREHRRGERAPEAGSRRQSCGIGGGRCLRMWATHMSMKGAPGPGKPLLLTQERGKRSSAHREEPGLTRRRAAGDRGVRGLIFRFERGWERRAEVAIAFGRGPNSPH